MGNQSRVCNSGRVTPSKKLSSF